MNEDYKVTVHQHDHGSGFRYCPVCGGSLESRLLKEGDPARLVCASCGYVFYLDPKLAVGTVISDEQGRIVLVRRAIEPGYGKWVFPGGYVDWGEPIDVAAIRETREETGLAVELDGLVGVYSYPGAPVVVIVYRARVLDGTLSVCHENDRVEWVAREAIPWDELAFPSTVDALRDVLAGGSRR